jgi:putative tryptophan/tyrosine transport system substrate-binding protein
LYRQLALEGGKEALTEGVVIGVRIYGGKEDVLPHFAGELVALRCGVIVAASPYAVAAAARATRVIPIVGVDRESDPVANGWARSLSRPDGNVTGEFLDLPELGGKQIQFLREVVPELARVAVLWDATIGQVQVRATEAAARTAGVQAQSLGIRLAADLPEAFARAAAVHDLRWQSNRRYACEPKRRGCVLVREPLKT